MPKTIYENLTRLKQHLGIRPINTGQQLNFGGIVSDDIEALHAIRSISGDCINLMSGVEFSLTEYRGQTQDYGNCLSGLDRIQDDHKLFAALCRSIYFKQALETHPVIMQMRDLVLDLDARTQPLPVCMNLEGIAQHYGLATEYLDITNNFSVASFFATQRWDSKTKKFEPMRATNAPGVIYKMHPVFMMAVGSVCDEMPYQPVGWQPFPRPEQQRANAIRLKPGEGLSQAGGAAKYYFQHSRNQSKRIHEEFEGGDKLMPADDLASFADSLETKNCFPQSTLDLAFQSYGERKQPQDTVDKRQSLMAKAGITLEEHDSFKTQEWSFKQEAFDAEIQRMLSKVRTRMVCYPPS